MAAAQACWRRTSGDDQGWGVHLLPRAQTAPGKVRWQRHIKSNSLPPRASRMGQETDERFYSQRTGKHVSGQARAPHVRTHTVQSDAIRRHPQLAQNLLMGL